MTLTGVSIPKHLSRNKHVYEKSIYIRLCSFMSVVIKCLCSWYVTLTLKLKEVDLVSRRLLE